MLDANNLSIRLRDNTICSSKGHAAANVDGTCSIWLSDKLSVRKFLIGSIPSKQRKLHICAKKNFKFSKARIATGTSFPIGVYDMSNPVTPLRARQ
jgi:hypothetical protein